MQFNNDRFQKVLVKGQFTLKLKKWTYMYKQSVLRKCIIKHKMFKRTTILLMYKITIVSQHQSKIYTTFINISIQIISLLYRSTPTPQTAPLNPKPTPKIKQFNHENRITYMLTRNMSTTCIVSYNQKIMFKIDTLF